MVQRLDCLVGVPALNDEGDVDLRFEKQQQQQQQFNALKLISVSREAVEEQLFHDCWCCSSSHRGKLGVSQLTLGLFLTQLPAHNCCIPASFLAIPHVFWVISHANVAAGSLGVFTQLLPKSA